jgi:hypothetical protein
MTGKNPYTISTKAVTRLAIIIDELQRIGEADTGSLPPRCAKAYHKAVDALRTVNFWITNIAEEESCCEFHGTGGDKTLSCGGDITKAGKASEP